VQPGGASLATGLPPPDDPWSAFLAPETVCPGRTDLSGSPAVQQATVVCLLNYAREHVGLAALPSSAEISGWSASKAADIKRCDDFSHSPCDEAADRYPRTAGFTGAFGENIFMGPQVYKTPLAAVDGWLNSQAHRENLFRTNWRAQGVAVLHTQRLRDQSDVAIWVSEFAT
jgi:uncharacterized protein YkwD